MQGGGNMIPHRQPQRMYNGLTHIYTHIHIHLNREEDYIK